MFYVLVKDSKILSVHLAPNLPEDGIEVSGELANIIMFDESNYWTYVDEKVVATPIIKEESKIISVSIRQARKALHQLNYLSSIESYMSVYGSEEDKIDWQYATEIKRNHPLVEQMRSMLNLTNKDIDNLFILASVL